MKIKHQLLLVAAIGLLSSCAKTEYGPTLFEDAEVYDTCYVPKGHGDGSGAGFTTGGDVAFTSVDVDIPARYAIVFKCQHGKFVIDGERGEALYKKLSKGDKVKVSYSVKYEVNNGQANAVGLHFWDADKS